MLIGLAVVGGIVTAAFQFPSVAPDGWPGSWHSGLRLAMFLAALFSSFLYAGLADTLSDEGWRAWRHRVAAGMVGGAACVLMFETSFDVGMIAMGAFFGAALSAMGLFGLLARGL